MYIILREISENIYNFVLVLRDDNILGVCWKCIERNEDIPEDALLFFSKIIARIYRSRISKNQVNLSIKKI